MQYLEILERCEALYGHAVIGGGCLRDGLLGAEVKDIDVFVPYLGEDDPMVHAKRISEVFGEGWHAGRLGPDGAAYVANVSDLNAVYEVWAGDGLDDWRTVALGFEQKPIQIIEMAEGFSFSPRSVVERFDLGFCQIVLSRPGDLYTTLQFQQDVADRVIRPTREKVSHHTVDRMYSLQLRKYGDWRVADPSPENIIPE